jgi:hypothetical protein
MGRVVSQIQKLNLIPGTNLKSTVCACTFSTVRRKQEVPGTSLDLDINEF